MKNVGRMVVLKVRSEVRWQEQSGRRRSERRNDALLPAVSFRRALIALTNRNVEGLSGCGVWAD